MTLVEISQKQANIPITIFTLQDRIHLGNFAEIEQIAKDAYKNGVRDLVIDLSKTESLTSIGVRALVIIHKLFSASGGSHLKLAGVIAPIRDMLEIAGITQFIEVYDTVEQAVAAF